MCSVRLLGKRMAYHPAKLNYETAHLIIQFLMRGKQGGKG